MLCQSFSGHVVSRPFVSDNTFPKSFDREGLEESVAGTSQSKLLLAASYYENWS